MRASISKKIRCGLCNGDRACRRFLAQHLEKELANKLTLLWLQLPDFLRPHKYANLPNSSDTAEESKIQKFNNNQSILQWFIAHGSRLMAHSQEPRRRTRAPSQTGTCTTISRPASLLSHERPVRRLGLLASQTKSWLLHRPAVWHPKNSLSAGRNK